MADTINENIESVFPNWKISISDDKSKAEHEDLKKTENLEGSNIELYFKNKKLEDKEFSSKSNRTLLTNQSYPGILDLPAELLLKIFSFFQVTELRTLSLVCHAFNNIAKDPLLWKILCFDCSNRIHQVNIEKILEKCPYVISLKIGSACVTASLLNVISNILLFIEMLTFKFCEFHTELKEELFYIGMHCKYLTHISFEGSILSSEMLCVIGIMKQLKSINLAYCRATDNLINTVIEQCDTLESLNIDGNYSIEDSTLRKLTALRFKTLKELWLDGDTTTDTAYSLIGKCSKLTNLSVSFCEGLTDKSLKEVQKLSNLSTLKLRKGLAFSAIAIAEIFTGNKLKNLTNLNLGECSLMENLTLQAIAEGCPNLCYFCINWCWEVTDDGLMHIVDKCRLITTLELVGLVKLSGTFLVDIVDKLQLLKIIDLEQCGAVEDEWLQIVIKQNNDLEIYDYYGDLVKPMPEHHANPVI